MRCRTLATTLAVVLLPAAGTAPAAAQVGETVVAGTASGHVAVATTDTSRLAELGVQVAGPDGRFGPEEIVADATRTPSVVVGPRGDVLVSWDRGVRGREEPEAWAAYRPPGGRFGSPVRLLARIDVEGWARIAIDGSGTATAAMIDATGRIAVRTRTPAGTWLPPLRFGGGRASRQDLAVAANGTAVVAWTEDTTAVLGDQPSTSRIYAATRGPGAASFGAPVALTPPAGAPSSVVAAVDDAGDAVVAWIDRRGGGADAPFAIHGVFSARGGRFGPPTLLSRGDASAPAVAVRPDGSMLLAWRDNERSRLEARVRTAAGVLQPPRLLTRRLALNAEPAIALDGEILAWHDDGSGLATDVRAVRLLPDGALGRPTTAARTRGTIRDAPLLVRLGGATRVVVAERPGTARPLRTVSVPPLG